MRLLTRIDWEHGMCWCSFCTGKVKAMYKHGHQLACLKHMARLIDTAIVTEADYQTWLE